MSYYSYKCDSDDGEVLGESKRHRDGIVKVGRSFLKMYRPHFDADALISGMTRRGIRTVRRAISKRHNKPLWPKEA